MKKISYLVLALAFALTTLSGCFNKVPDIEDRILKDVDTQYEYTGIIESVEIDAYQQGTHRIAMDNNDFVIIQSRNFDLNRYLDNRVIVKGVYVKVIGDAEPVLNVEEIKFENNSDLGEVLEYENSLYGLSFLHSTAWDLAEDANGLSLVKDGYKWVKITVYNDKSDFNSFVSSQEHGEGVSITIAAQGSLRFIKGSSIHIYIPNPPKKKIYKIVFNEDGEYADKEREDFNEFLKSIRLIYMIIKKGEKCGGKENIKCEEGYRCEFDSAEDHAEGVCVSLNPEDASINCPFIPAPNCTDYRVAEYSKATGCPTRYECIDNEHNSAKDVVDVNSLIKTVQNYQERILNISGAKIIQFELTESEKLIAIIYEFEGEKYKTLYSFSPSANEFNFMEKAHFKTGENGDWELISGEDLQNNYSKTIIKAENIVTEASSGAVADVPRKVSEDMSLYENQHKDFSLGYPKNWYYRSFGAVNNTLWTVGFADKSLDNLSDAIIKVSLLSKNPNNSDFGYFTVRDRNDGTFFVLEGPNDLSQTIDKMADSIE